MKNSPLSDLPTLALVCALGLSVPAFYLRLSGPTMVWQHGGSVLYGAMGLLMCVRLARQWPALRRHRAGRTEAAFDAVLAAGALLSVWPDAPPWTATEWVARLGFCALAFGRMGTVAARLLAPHHILQTLGAAALVLALSGAGFWWLEPKVTNYGDGLWLAFITGATVGYGDLVPSTPASRILAVFIVLLCYAMFSVLTASISALFVNVDEKAFQKDLHADMRALREEIDALREDLHSLRRSDRRLRGEASPAERTPH